LLVEADTKPKAIVTQLAYRDTIQSWGGVSQAPETSVVREAV